MLIVRPDPVAHSLVLLGTCDDNPAILVLKKTAFREQQDYALYFNRLESVEKNDIVGRSTPLSPGNSILKATPVPCSTGLDS